MNRLIKSPARRRSFLRAVAGAVLAPIASVATKHDHKTVRIAEFDSNGKKTGLSDVEKITKSTAEWRKLLAPEQFAVARQAGTERAFTGKYHAFHGDGLYQCVCCRTTLFDSRTKFESGTGWPSFWAPVAKENVTLRGDNSLGMDRAEVLC